MATWDQAAIASLQWQESTKLVSKMSGRCVVFSLVTARELDLPIKIYSFYSIAVQMRWEQAYVPSFLILDSLKCFSVFWEKLPACWTDPGFLYPVFRKPAEHLGHEYTMNIKDLNEMFCKTFGKHAKTFFFSTRSNWFGLCKIEGVFLPAYPFSHTRYFESPSP